MKEKDPKIVRGAQPSLGWETNQPLQASAKLQEECCLLRCPMGDEE